MKKFWKCLKKRLSIIIFFGVLIQSNKGNAQITLEQTFDSTTIGYFYRTDIGNNDLKFVFQNPKTNSFSLYNMDMSEYLLNIQIPVTDSICKGFNVIYISKTLFDCDSTNIEYAYNNPNDIYHKFRIFRTDGTLLFQLDSANRPFQVGRIYGGSYKFRPIKNTSAGPKLFLQKYHNNGVPEIHVYPLCGMLPASIMEFRNDYDVLKIYPDLTAMKLNFDFIQPNNQGRFLLFIRNSDATFQKKVGIDNNYSLDVNNFSNGTYFYTILFKNKVCQSGEFIINK